MSVVGAVAADVKIDAAPVTITFPNGHFHPLLAIGPIEAGNAENPAFHIGKLTAETDVVLTTGQLTSAKVAIVDFRLGEIEGVSDGLVGSLFPDLRESEGFSLSVDVVNGTV